MRHHAVITGIGIIAPVGVGAAEVWPALLSGRSGIRLLPFDLPRPAGGKEFFVADVVRFRASDWMSERLAHTTGRFSQLAIATATMALQDSGLVLGRLRRDRLGISLGTSMNGLVDVLLPQFQGFLDGEEVSPRTFAEFPAQAATVHVAKQVSAQGPCSTMAGACSAGLDAIAWAADRIREGHADVIVAGASESPISPGTFEAFRRSGILSRWGGPPEGASRPFDRDHSGLVVGEGAATVIVENETYARERGATVWARILGTASATEINGDLDRSGTTAAEAICTALRRSDLTPLDIDYISAHGNSIPEHDVAETAGFRLALGAQAYRVSISSFKSTCGQAFAASSAMQVVVGCLALRDNIVPPTINHEAPAAGCDLDYVANRARPVRVRNVLIHARSLGGVHSAMVLGRS